MRKIKVPVTIGRIKAYLVSDVINGNVEDTKVVIGDRTVCEVAGTDRFRVIDELNNVINKYKI